MRKQRHVDRSELLKVFQLINYGARTNPRQAGVRTHAFHHPASLPVCLECRM